MNNNEVKQQITSDLYEVVKKYVYKYDLSTIKLACEEAVNRAFKAGGEATMIESDPDYYPRDGFDDIPSAS